jgi:hypothetical protein
MISAERSQVRRIHVQRPMRSMTVVVHEVGEQDGLEVTSSQNEDAIEAITPHGADKPLRERVCKRFLDRGSDNPYSLG